MERRDRVRLSEILGAARDAVEIASGKARGDLDTEKVLGLALTKCLEIVGEAASRVSPSTRDALTQVEWRNMRQMRNVLIHQYSSVDYDIVWQTVQEDLPGLISTIEQVLAEAE